MLQQFNKIRINKVMKKIIAIVFVIIVVIISSVCMKVDNDKTKSAMISSQKVKVEMKNNKTNLVKSANAQSSKNIEDIYPFLYEEQNNKKIIVQNQSRKPINLPQIPNYSIKNENIKIPGDLSIPTFANSSRVNQISSNKIEGIITKEDGNGMVIMSDGKIMQAGDMYMGDKITYIDQSGMKLSNGEKISYDMNTEASK